MWTVFLSADIMLASVLMELFVGSLALLLINKYTAAEVCWSAIAVLQNADCRSVEPFKQIAKQYISLILSVH